MQPSDEELDKAIASARDALLDHIDEYGTTAEGVQRFVRKIGRAAIAESWRINGITPKESSDD